TRNKTAFKRHRFSVKSLGNTFKSSNGATFHLWQHCRTNRQRECFQSRWHGYRKQSCCVSYSLSSCYPIIGQHWRLYVGQYTKDRYHRLGKCKNQYFGNVASFGFSATAYIPIFASEF